ncbi:hypothetical protein [Photobacterium nomapromontoriensis]|uniref:hypothetical protein n=1 Tax=Photobacterium nomapromontoriensis TaxID=2910237 RepID=UPI003D11C55E
MTIRNITNTATYTPASVKAASARLAHNHQSAEQATVPPMAAAPVAATQVSISDTARQRQASEMPNQTSRPAGQEGATEKAEAFAFGVLGMGHPSEVKNEGDEYYTAGQVLSAMGTVATVLLAIV